MVKPPSSKIALPENVDDQTLQVTFDDLCEIPMQYVGLESHGHEFKCDAAAGQCPRATLCPQFRHIDFDNGCFQRILYGSEQVSKAF
ncbi:MAG: transposase, partial [bacterium]|nr:transposase [bacterium]